MNLADTQEYANKLKKAEKMQKLREDVCIYKWPRLTLVIYRTV